MDDKPIDFSDLSLPPERFEKMVRAVLLEPPAAPPARALRNGHAPAAPMGGAREAGRKPWKSVWALVAAIAVLGAAFAAWRGASDGGVGGEGPGGAQSGSEKKPHVIPRFDPLAWAAPHSSLKDMAVPGGTPPLEPAPTDADGHLEVEVLAAGAPEPGAEVRLYWRGRMDPSGLFFQWRLAGGGVTDARGQSSIAAGPGAYVLAVRAKGFAVARREVSRPAGEARTRVKLELDKGSVLRGRVVEAQSGAEVPLAQLTLARLAPSTAMALPESSAGAPSEEVLFATADARGRFELPEVEAGEYRLVATAPGHARATRQLLLPRASEEVVTLRSASNLEGYVVDANGAPAAGAEVTVRFSTLKGLHEVEEVSKTTAGPYGGFAVEVPPGRCALSAQLGESTGAAEKPVVVSIGQTVRGITIRLGASGAIEGTVVAKDTHAPVDGALVALSPNRGFGDLGQTTTADGGHFALQPLASGVYDVEVRAEGYPPLIRSAVTLAAGQRFPMSLELEAPASATGTVRDAAGNPVADAVVEAGRFFGGPLTWSSGSEARTAADGSYVLRGLEVGPVRLTAGRDPGEPLAVQSAALESGKETRVDFVLRESGTLAGQVTSKSGAPLSGDAVVRAIPRDGPMPTPADLRLAAVGADGRYALDLSAGQYSVRAYSADESGAVTPPVGPAIAVAAGQTTELDLTLDDGPPLLSGTVLEPDGSPSPLAWVRISTGASSSRMLRADETGQFELESLEPSDYAPELPDLVDVLAKNGGRVGRLDGVAKGASGVTVQLGPGGAIHGTVSGQPAPDTEHVQVMTVDDALWFMVGGNGQEFLGTSFDVGDVPATAVRVTVTASDGRSGSAEVNVPAGGTAQVSIDLQGTASVSGRLLGPGGKAVVGALVGVDLASPSLAATDGSFALGGLADGRHLLRAFAPGMATLQKPLVLNSGQTLDVGTLMLAPQKPLH